MFIRLLTAPVNASNQTKGVFLNNEECEYQPALINTLKYLCNKVCVPNKTEDLNISIFDMFTWINDSKTLTKHI